MSILSTIKPVGWLVAHNAVTFKLISRFYSTPPTLAGKRGYHQRLWALCSQGGLVVYLLGRLCIIVEVLGGLAFLTPEAFISSWTPTVIPHLD
jgi:hypothetical protein